MEGLSPPRPPHFNHCRLLIYSRSTRRCSAASGDFCTAVMQKCTISFSRLSNRVLFLIVIGTQTPRWICNKMRNNRHCSNFKLQQSWKVMTWWIYGTTHQTLMFTVFLCLQSHLKTFGLYKAQLCFPLSSFEGHLSHVVRFLPLNSGIQFSGIWCRPDFLHWCSNILPRKSRLRLLFSLLRTLFRLANVCVILTL